MSQAQSVAAFGPGASFGRNCVTGTSIIRSMAPGRRGVSVAFSQASFVIAVPSDPEVRVCGTPPQTDLDRPQSGSWKTATTRPHDL